MLLSQNARFFSNLLDYSSVFHRLDLLMFYVDSTLKWKAVTPGRAACCATICLAASTIAGRLESSPECQGR